MTAIPNTTPAAAETQQPNADLSLAAYREQRAAAPAPETKEPAKEHVPAEGAAALGETAAPSDEADETTEQVDEVDAAGQTRRKGGWQRKIERLERELAEAKRTPATPAAVAAPAAAAPAPAPVLDPKPAEYAKPEPKLEDFDSIAAYTKAATAWEIDRRDHVRAETARIETEKQQRAQHEAEAKAVVATWNQRKAAFVAEHADFDAVLATVKDLKLSPAHQRIFLESENGPALAYELAQDPDELKRIAALPPLAAAREIGKLEASFASSAPKEKPTVSAAPRPIRPVTGGSAPATRPDPAKLSLGEYRAQRAAGRIK